MKQKITIHSLPVLYFGFLFLDFCDFDSVSYSCLCFVLFCFAFCSSLSRNMFSSPLCVLVSSCVFHLLVLGFPFGLGVSVSG